MAKPRTAPSFVKGRRGGLSVIDAMVRALWVRKVRGGEYVWPCLPIGEICDTVARKLGYDIPSSTVRSELYRKTDIFEKNSADGSKVTYRLTGWARRQRG